MGQVGSRHHAFVIGRSSVQVRSSAPCFQRPACLLLHGCCPRVSHFRRLSARQRLPLSCTESNFEHITHAVLTGSTGSRPRPRGLFRLALECENKWKGVRGKWPSSISFRNDNRCSARKCPMSTSTPRYLKRCVFRLPTFSMTFSVARWNTTPTAV